MLSASIIYQNVQAAQSTNCFGYQSLAKRLIPKVAGNGQSNSPLRFDQLNYLAGIRFLSWEVIDGNVCPFTCIGYRCRSPHSGVTPRNEGFSALEAARSMITGFAVVRLGVHFTRQPWPGLRLTFKGRL